MPLMQKGSSPATTGANRANARKSTGPKTVRGKTVSSRNATNWGRAERMRELMPALGEKPEEFEALLAGLRRALGPRDAFEEILVTDMAEIRWRLQLMILGDMARRALHRREKQARDEETDARMEAGRLQELEPSLISELGMAGLHDSPPKFARLIPCLQAVDTLVQEQGFPSEGPAYLKIIYGQRPGLRGTALIHAYEAFSQEEKAGTAEASAANRAKFHGLMTGEIAWFEERAARDRQARAEMKVPRTEAGLDLPEEKGTSVLNQERLERRFERKWRLLVRYRRNELREGGHHSPSIASGAP